MTAPTSAAPKVGSAALYMVPTVLSMVLPFATLPIMTRRLTPEDYGVLALGQVVAAVFMGLAGLGVHAGLQRNFFKHEADPAGLARVMHSGIALAVAGILTLGLGLVLARDWLSMLIFGVPDWAMLLVAMSAASSLGVLTSIHLTYLRNRERARRYMLFETVGLIGEAGGAVALVIAGFGVWGIVLGALGTKAVLAIVLWAGLARELRPAFDVRASRELLAIGLPLLPRVLVGSADNGVDRLLVNWLRSLGQAGLFAIANRVGYSVFAVLTSIENVYIPHVYRLMFREPPETGGTTIGRYLSPYFYVSVLVAALAVLFLEEALFVLVTPAFYDVKYLGAVLATYYGQMFFGKVTGAQLIYLKKTWYATPLSAVRLCLHLGLAFAFISRFGVLGAAFSLLATGIVVDTMAFVIVQRAYRIRYERGVVIPGLVLLYGALGWVLFAGYAEMPYGARLAGKLIVLAFLLGLGRRWLGTIFTELLGRWRRPNTPAASPAGPDIRSAGESTPSRALAVSGRAEE